MSIYRYFIHSLPHSFRSFIHFFLMKHLTLLLLLACFFEACSPKLGAYKAPNPLSAPDYSHEKDWVALPFRHDAADFTPKNETWIDDSLKKVDVFYVYPTNYKKGKTWNADINDRKLNKNLDKMAMKYQASVFNKVGRIYTPRYRQAIVQCFHESTDNSQAALDFAYQDVKHAFEYYLKHYNKGRPIVIAAHSQGTVHARRLLKDFFDTPEQKKQLVCAYIVGLSVHANQYQVLTPCKSPAETNCYVTWSSFKKGYNYTGNVDFWGDVCVNPVSWTTDTLTACSNGSVMTNISRKKPYHTEAQIKGNFLWVDTKMPFVRNFKILHFLDYNLFWHDIQNNVALRADEYLNKTK